MNLPSKLFLSIPPLIGIIYSLTFFNVDFFKWFNNNIVPFEYQNALISAVTLPHIGYLIYRLWSYNNIAKKTKTEWTVLLIWFNVISSLFYIWKKDDEFRQRNKNTVPNNA
jgi:hypothetical protein